MKKVGGRLCVLSRNWVGPGLVAAHKVPSYQATRPPGPVLRAGILSLCVLSLGASLSAGLRIGSGEREADRDGYTPVAPARAILAGLRSNLKVVREWLDDRDLDSAAEAADGVRILAALSRCQRAADPWPQRADELAKQADSLMAAAKKKDAAESMVAWERCKKLLEELDALSPDLSNGSSGGGAGRVAQPIATVRGMMKLMDGTYIDAKTAKTSEDFKLFAFALAEEAHAMAYLRNDSNWPRHAEAVRDTALEIARLEPDSDLQTARRALKNVYEHCQACHKAYKR